MAALIEAGAVYYSDEFAVVDPDGWVYPYPQPLGLRSPGSFSQEHVAVETLYTQATTARTPARVGTPGDILPCPGAAAPD